jgi:hypothetical protein
MLPRGFGCGCGAHALPKSYPSIGLMGIDGRARLGRAFVQANRIRRVIRANIVGIGGAHSVAARGSCAVALGLGWLPFRTAGFPYHIQSNL